MSQLVESIQKVKSKFLSIIEANPDIKVEWQKESMFAMQQLYKTDFATKVAANNPRSVQNAVINVASIGLSLNPATSYAYLVPRDNQICLDISYRGLIKIATDTGSIMWAKADVVYSSDSFEYNGPAEKPTHKADVFSADRGEVVGVYCVAKTCDGDYLVEVMSEKEVNDIKSKSMSASGNGAKYSPWTTFPNEMRKKAVIKRASKTWPKTDRHERLDNVIEYVNREEGIDFDNQPTEEDCKLFNDYVHERNGAAIQNLYYKDWEYWAKVESTFYEKGKKGAYAKMIREMIKSAISYVQEVAESIIEFGEANNIDASLEAYNEMNNHETELFWTTVMPEQKVTINNILGDSHA